MKRGVLIPIIYTSFEDGFATLVNHDVGQSMAHRNRVYLANSEWIRQLTEIYAAHRLERPSR